MKGRPKGSAKTPRSGRKVGTPNHATVKIKEAARAHGLEAIQLLAAIMNNPRKPDATRMQAADKLLDRGYGRPAQPVGGEPDEPITVIVTRFFPDDDPAEDQPIGRPFSPPLNS